MTARLWRGWNLPGKMTMGREVGGEKEEMWFMLRGTQPRPFSLYASPTTAPSPGSGQGGSQPSPSAYLDFIHAYQRHQQAQLPSSPLSRVHSLTNLAYAVLYQLECSVTL